MSSYGICPLSVVPIRSTPSDKSEMISQLLFGELFEVLETKGRKWLKIRGHSDNCVGWLPQHQTKPVTPTEFQQYQQHFAFSLDLVQAVMADDHFLPITLGARLPLFDGIRFHLGEKVFTFSGQAVFPEHLEADADLVIKIARRYLNAPYLWGGRSPFGIDSPGLVQVVFQMAGFSLPREAEGQVMEGQSIDFMEQARPGDLAFCEDRFGRIAHVGILLPGGGVIHADGKVRIDKIDHYGIFQEEERRYTHRLRVIKRILPPATSANSSRETRSEPASRQAELF